MEEEKAKVSKPRSIRAILFVTQNGSLILLKPPIDDPGAMVVHRVVT